jgi:hypothetical protein
MELSLHGRLLRLPSLPPCQISQVLNLVKLTSYPKPDCVWPGVIYNFHSPTGYRIMLWKVVELTYCFLHQRTAPRWMRLRLPHRLRRRHFEYQPLDSSALEIRVLDVRALSSSRKAITCERRHISLKSDPVPPYEALSYRWGNSERCKSIPISGKRLRVPANTEAALRRMASRDTGKRCTLWIDTVCINQHDI